MFTGLITDIGRVVSVKGGRIQIGCGHDLEEASIGASIACDGCCLTVVSLHEPADGFTSVFAVDVSNETFAKTTLGTWKAGRKVNLERSLTPTTELGGHIVAGHVDGVATITDKRKDGDSVRFKIETPPALVRFIAPKGSVTLDGVSLTVNDVADRQFGVNLIPHTLAVTTWGEKEVGDPINLEVDLLARYVARLADVEGKPE